MKKRTILFGSLLAVFLMLMIPNISAVEFFTIKETVESKITTIQEKIKGFPIEHTGLQTIIETIDNNLDILDTIALILVLMLIGGITVISVVNAIKFFLSGEFFLAFVWLINFILGTIDVLIIIRAIRDLESSETC